jgi:hypothetical protein
VNALSSAGFCASGADISWPSVADLNEEPGVIVRPEGMRCHLQTTVGAPGIDGSDRRGGGGRGHTCDVLMPIVAYSRTQSSVA